MSQQDSQQAHVEDFVSRNASGSSEPTKVSQGGHEIQQHDSWMESSDNTTYPDLRSQESTKPTSSRQPVSRASPNPAYDRPVSGHLTGSTLESFDSWIFDDQFLTELPTPQTATQNRMVVSSVKKPYDSQPEVLDQSLDKQPLQYARQDAYVNPFMNPFSISNSLATPKTLYHEHEDDSFHYDPSQAGPADQFYGHMEDYLRQPIAPSVLGDSKIAREEVALGYPHFPADTIAPPPQYDHFKAAGNHMRNSHAMQPEHRSIAGQSYNAYQQHQQAERFKDLSQPSLHLPKLLPRPSQHQPPLAPPNQAPPASGSGIRLRFANRGEGLREMSIRPITWRSPRNDMTIPQTDAGRVVVVQRLLAAMIDITEAKDSGRSFQRRWATRSEDQPFYDLKDMEIVCWELAHIAERLHRNGPAELMMFDPDALKNNARTQDLTFEERIDNLCQLMRYSKARCDILMKGDSWELVVVQSKLMLQESKINRKQNTTRKKIQKLGRKALRRQERPEGEEEDSDAEGTALVDNVDKSAADDKTDPLLTHNTPISLNKPNHRRKRSAMESRLDDGENTSANDFKRVKQTPTPLEQAPNSA
ncbi:hypothetical protein P153DRAFT_390420 [Dothidotthia symphoricarpi CBS 119687]|uniref:Uncharacterized protein n=1 Tax=Dothidotthia symphoricarpi CBS 119687 TaxID=1392245 RepID=A0A6A5ZX99_9PLEO|nr:uncharacterized protein P153DRAFT_390420 [Dothidotthia symphoricarpi CBS 119687]KAF2124382.1 hypothetical protein P153DRAFT_390420 [Dothidotthia symphoricarpi CBS 119687]